MIPTIGNTTRDPALHANVADEIGEATPRFAQAIRVEYPPLARGAAANQRLASPTLTNIFRAAAALNACCAALYLVKPGALHAVGGSSPMGDWVVRTLGSYLAFLDKPCTFLDLARAQRLDISGNCVVPRRTNEYAPLCFVPNFAPTAC